MRSMTALPVLRFRWTSTLRPALVAVLAWTFAAAPGAPAAAQAGPATDGFLYGTVTTHDGDEHTGRLRWG
ncbi:MAG TPA: hypothetical protein VLF66_17535, partial [Thermoanaerobaculia bacterium]|nr:hypothetical protein [Thermoanaerobaculia bacterium]